MLRGVSDSVGDGQITPVISLMSVSFLFQVWEGPRAPPRMSPAVRRRGSKGGTMGSPAPPVWGARPSEVIMVKNKEDLHNLSHDSGLSHSPIQPHPESPQLTIGQPIKHVENLKPPRTRVTGMNKNKNSRWNFGSLFKRKTGTKIYSGSDSEVREEEGIGVFWGKKKF